MGLLSQFPADDVATFLSDFRLLLSASENIDREVSDVDYDAPKNIPVFKELIGHFKKKYPSFHVEADLRHYHPRPSIYITCISLYDLFTRIVVNIEGVRAAGDTSVEQRTAENRQKMLEEASRVRSQMQIFFVGYNNNLMLLKFVDKNRGAQLIYDKTSIVDGMSPDFQICCYMALHQGFRHEIKLHTDKFRFEMNTTLGGIREPH